jgi:hypothetical protein
MMMMIMGHECMMWTVSEGNEPEGGGGKKDIEE